MIRLRNLTLLTTLICASTAVQAQNYKTIVVFGDSLSDTGNDSHLFAAAYGFRFPGTPTVFDYTDGRFTDGFDTFPAAQNYSGVWVEQLAAMLPSKPATVDSLDGGKNYAYGFAFTVAGTEDFALTPPYNAFQVKIDNIGLQITDYLATHPKIDRDTLFVVWGGANDVLNAASPADVVNAAIAQAGNVERLIDAGATQFIVPNLPPLGAIPNLNGYPTLSALATQLSVLFNQTLASGLDVVLDSNHGRKVRLFPFDIFALVNNILASPSAFALVNVTSSAQGVSPLNPDTYLFWDGLHPTTRGHNIVAAAAAELIEAHKCMVEPTLAASSDRDDSRTDGDWECVAAGGDRDSGK